MIKQRIARRGEGKSGGSRSLLLFKKGHRAVFVAGFEKKDRANIDRQELEAFRQLAAQVLAYTESEIDMNVQNRSLLKVEEPEDDNGKVPQ